MPSLCSTGISRHASDGIEGEEMKNGQISRPSRYLFSHHGLIAVLTIVLVICTAETATADTLDDAKESVRSHLFIPGSAKFSNLHKHGNYICGKVEAQTLAGTYDAAKVIIYDTKTQLSTIVDGSQISKLMTDSMKRDLDHACSPSEK